jgi:hypothetical protein
MIYKADINAEVELQRELTASLSRLAKLKSLEYEEKMFNKFITSKGVLSQQRPGYFKEWYRDILKFRYKK